jgi:Holliday junction resolvasome RuvABC endonuclease subunit
MTVVLALDSGALRCGIAVLSYENDKLTYLHSEIFGVERGEQRYQDYRLSLIAAFADKAAFLVELYQPDVVVAEIIPVAGMSRASAQRQLAATASTAFLTVATARGFKCEQIAATTVKKALTGSGRATKTVVRNGVIASIPSLKKVLMDNKSISDEADALAIGLSYGKLKLKWQIN